MSGAMDEFTNRVTERVWLLVSAKITARVELEVARTQAQLLAQAAAFRRGHGKLGEQIAQRLEHTSEQLVRELSGSFGESNWTSSLNPAPGGDGARASVGSDETDATEKRRRGRPKKVLDGAAPQNGVIESLGTLKAMDEVTHEERTGARDPAGADQVPDLSAEDIER